MKKLAESNRTSLRKWGEGHTPTSLGGIVENYGLFSRIRRSDVAAWMLDTLEAPISLKERKVMIGTSKR